MVFAIRSYTSQTIIGIFDEGIQTAKLMVNSVGLGVLFQVGISFYFCRYYPNVFAAGLVIGFVFDKQVASLVKKVDLVFNNHRTLLEKLALYVVGGFLALLFLPISSNVIALYQSSRLALLFWKTTNNRYPPGNNPATTVRFLPDLQSDDDDDDDDNEQSIKMESPPQYFFPNDHSDGFAPLNDFGHEEL